MQNANSKVDLSSQSNAANAASTHIHLEWTLDFEQKIISGSATHFITVAKSGTMSVTFDSNGLIFDEAYIISEVIPSQTEETAKSIKVFTCLLDFLSLLFTFPICDFYYQFSSYRIIFLSPYVYNFVFKI